MGITHFQTRPYIIEYIHVYMYIYILCMYVPFICFIHEIIMNPRIPSNPIRAKQQLAVVEAWADCNAVTTSGKPEIEQISMRHIIELTSWKYFSASCQGWQYLYIICIYIYVLCRFYRTVKINSTMNPIYNH